VRVIQATTANVRSNAEYLLASLLMLYRRGIGSALIGDRHADIRMGRELNGSVVGILGLAPTAHALALMLHAAGRQADWLRPGGPPHGADLGSGCRSNRSGLSELMAQSDAVSVQVMYASRYKGFINHKVLAPQAGQLWVGTSRSPV
jgi:phosphoglycerate dehydrogenase-like enzyme